MNTLTIVRDAKSGMRTTEILMENLPTNLVDSYEQIGMYLEEASRGLLDENGDKYNTFSRVQLEKARSEMRFMCEVLNRTIIEYE